MGNWNETSLDWLAVDVKQTDAHSAHWDKASSAPLRPSARDREYTLWPGDQHPETRNTVGPVEIRDVC